MQLKHQLFLQLLNNILNQKICCWNNCVSLSVDNKKVMIGKRNSIASRFINNNPEIFN